MAIPTICKCGLDSSKWIVAFATLNYGTI